MATDHTSIFKVIPVAILLLTTSVNATAERWRPSPTPDPIEISREATNDAQEGRYELALQKHVWYHNNALKYQPSLVGVRLSYALADWKRLADRHPPALQEMQRVRDSAEERARDDKGDFSAFQDTVAINNILNEDGRTIDLFKWLDEHADVRYTLLARKAAYIISILTNVGRSSDAKIIAEQVLQNLEDEKLKVQIGDALRGIPP